MDARKLMSQFVKLWRADLVANKTARPTESSSNGCRRRMTLRALWPFSMFRRHSHMSQAYLYSHQKFELHNSSLSSLTINRSTVDCCLPLLLLTNRPQQSIFDIIFVYNKIRSLIRFGTNGKNRCILCDINKVSDY